MRIWTTALPYPPSVNSLWRYTARGVYRTKKYKQWLDDAGAGIHEKPNFDCPVKMQIRACAPDKRRRDLDNIIKPIGDLFEHCSVITNDSLFHWIDVKWDSAVEKSSAQIVLTTMPESP